MTPIPVLASNQIDSSSDGNQIKFKKNNRWYKRKCLKGCKRIYYDKILAGSNFSFTRIKVVEIIYHFFRFLSHIMHIKMRM